MRATTRICNSFDSNYYREKLIDAYVEMILQKIEDEWNAFIVTIMFKQLAGRRIAVRAQMMSEASRVFHWISTDMVRNSKSEHGWKRLPMVLYCADYSYKEVCNINDTGHVQGVFLKPKRTRLKMGLIRYSKLEHDRLVGNHGLVERVRFDRISNTPDKATRYVLKSLRKRLIGSDEVALFPPSASELASPVYGRGQRLGLPSIS